MAHGRQRIVVRGLPARQLSVVCEEHIVVSTEDGEAVIEIEDEGIPAGQGLVALTVIASP